MPEERKPESVCWWDDPLDLAHAATRTRDYSHARVERHWHDADLKAAQPASVRERGVEYAAMSTTELAEQREQTEMNRMREEKRTEAVASKTRAFNIAQFLKLNGAVWGGRAENRALDIPRERPMLHVPLMHTRSELPTFAERD